MQKYIAKDEICTESVNLLPQPKLTDYKSHQGQRTVESSKSLINKNFILHNKDKKCYTYAYMHIYDAAGCRHVGLKGWEETSNDLLSRSDR